MISDDKIRKIADIVRARYRSGLTAIEFAKRCNIPYNHLLRWCARFRKGTTDTSDYWISLCGEIISPKEDKTNQYIDSCLEWIEVNLKDLV